MIVFGKLDTKSLSNKHLIEYITQLRTEFDNDALLEMEYNEGMDIALKEAQYRISNGFLAWDDYPDYVPFKPGDKAYINRDHYALDGGTMITIVSIEYIDPDPMFNMYQAYPDRYSTLYVREYEIGADKL